MTATPHSLSSEALTTVLEVVTTSTVADSVQTDFHSISVGFDTLASFNIISSQYLSQHQTRFTQIYSQLQLLVYNYLVLVVPYLFINV